MSAQPAADRPVHAAKTALIFFDAVKGFIGGGMSTGRSEPTSRKTEFGALAFRFQIAASYFEESVTVTIDIPDVDPSTLLDWHDWDKTNALTRQRLLLAVDGKPMPFATALAFTAIRLGDAKRAWERRALPHVGMTGSDGRAAA